MADEYGSDFMTIVDEDGTEFELEVLSTLEYNGFTALFRLKRTAFYKFCDISSEGFDISLDFNSVFLVNALYDLSIKGVINDYRFVFVHNLCGVYHLSLGFLCRTEKEMKL